MFGSVKSEAMYNKGARAAYVRSSPSSGYLWTAGLRASSEAATRMEAAIAEAARREELPFLRE